MAAKPDAYYSDGIDPETDISVEIKNRELPWYITVTGYDGHEAAVVDLDIEEAERFAKAILCRVDWIKMHEYEAINNK